MAWTNPETFTAGQTLTAASMNALSGNDGFLYTPPMCRVVRTSDTSFTSGTAVTFQSASSGDKGFDTDTMFDVGSPTRITIKTAGVYAVTFSPYVTSSGGTYGQAFIKLNGSTFLTESDATNAVTGTVLLSVNVTYSFAVNDYIEGFVAANGTSLTQKGVTVPTFMSAVWVGKP